MTGGFRYPSSFGHGRPGAWFFIDVIGYGCTDDDWINPGYGKGSIHCRLNDTELYGNDTTSSRYLGKRDNGDGRPKDLKEADNG